jgi:hypothetical protein
MAHIPSPCTICSRCVPQESILAALRKIKALWLIQPINNRDRNRGHTLLTIIKLYGISTVHSVYLSYNKKTGKERMIAQAFAMCNHTRLLWIYNKS